MFPTFFCRFSYLLGFQNDLVYAYEKTDAKIGISFGFLSFNVAFFLFE